MLSRLSHNWLLKIMALIISVALWSHVRGQVNPWENMTFKIRLRAEAPRGFLMLNESELPSTIAVTLYGPRLALRGLKGATPANPLAPSEETPLLSSSEIHAFLDISNPRRGEQNAVVRVNMNDGIEDIDIVAARPAEVRVLLDVAETRRMSVQPQVLVDDEFEVERVVPSREKVNLFAPSKLLDRATQVRARARVPQSELKPGVVLLNDVPLETLDRKGEVLAEVLTEPARVDLEVTLREKQDKKPVRVEVEPVGSPAQNYKIGAAEAVPERITIRGPRRALSRIGSVTAQIDVSEARRNLNRRVPVQLPAGIISDTEHVRVRVRIEEDTLP